MEPRPTLSWAGTLYTVHFRVLLPSNGIL